ICFVRRPTNLVLEGGLVLELLLLLFPPMRATLVAADGDIILGRTRHFFLFGDINGGRTIDTGPFVAFTPLIATAALLVMTLESAFQSRGGTSDRPPS